MLKKLILAVLVIASPAFAEFPSSQPYPGVRYWHEQRTKPAMSVFVVQVDLADPNVKLRVSKAGDDPDGPAGDWETVLMVPSQIAAREQFDVCINASFFSAKQTKDAEGAASGFVAGKWSSAVGAAITDGQSWSGYVKRDWPVFWIDGSNRAHCTMGDQPIDGATQAVQGNAFVLKNGEVTEPQGMMKVRHPRTVIGIDDTGTKLTLLTVDGRRPGVSIGMTGPELGAEMKRLGCTTAINLDGGGSTELVLRNCDSGELQVMNNPSDFRERAVADVIGIQIHGVKRATTQPAIQQ